MIYNNLRQEEKATGQLFGTLFSAFDMDNYLRSVELFSRRFADAGFDLSYFKGKKCLDVGCGGGRYAVALSRLGALHVTGVDISEAAISDARAKAACLQIENVTFYCHTGEHLPFDSNSFDCVLFSGVLMHMSHPEKALEEISRVVKPGGLVYLLVYATQGIRWPLINILRNIAQYIGFETFERRLQQAGLDVNKRRTYLDDLFVPNIDFYSWKRLQQMLETYGFTQVQRWKKGRLDHEENLEAYHNDLAKLSELFNVSSGSTDSVEATLLQQAGQVCTSCLQLVKSVIEMKNEGRISEQAAMKMVIGQGHHRVTAIKKQTAVS